MFPYPQKIANSDEPFRNHSKKMNLAQIPNNFFFAVRTAAYYERARYCRSDFHENSRDNLICIFITTVRVWRNDCIKIISLR